MTMRILGENEVRALATMEGGFRACEQAYRYYGERRDVLSHPSSAFLTLPRDKPAKCRLKGAHLASLGVAGVRLASPGNYFCWVIDFESGAPIGLVAEDWLHRRRTATTGALVAQWLAGREVRTAGLIGTGRIADEFAATLQFAFDLADLRVASRTPSNAEAFVRRHSDGAGPLRAVGGIREAVEGSEVVVTITTAKEPFIEPGWLAPGAVLLPMGGCPETQFGVLDEIDRVIVDDLDYAMVQGDLHAWIAAGHISVDGLTGRIDGDIGEVAIGALPGRTGPDERILAIIQGMAVCDVAMAKMVLDRAGEENVGQVVEI